MYEILALLLAISEAFGWTKNSDNGVGYSLLRRRLYKERRNVTLWKADRSPACRAVMMALDAMNLSVNEVDVNLDLGEHRTPDMLERNPYQTLPVLQDNALILRDSHAICAYLASRYSSCGRLLPRDPGGRAIVEQQMQYNGGVLHPRYRAAVDPILYEDCNFVMPHHVCSIECGYADLECMLGDKEWFGGCWPTLGDICLAATVSTLHCLVPINKMRFPRLSCWLFRMSEEVYYITANKKGLIEFVQRIDCGCPCDPVFKCPRASYRRRFLATTPTPHS